MASKNPISDAVSMFGAPPSTDHVIQGTLDAMGIALPDHLETIAQQLQQLQALNQTQIDMSKANTRAADPNTGANGSSTLSTIGKTIENVFGFGLGVSPLISGLMSLFGGGGDSQPAPLVPYVAPPPVHANAGFSTSSPGQAFGVDSMQGGLPRPVTSTQITVQVQAMDSQSFLDHSQDIAMAVRQAMLESSTLSDVIREA